MSHHTPPVYDSAEWTRRGVLVVAGVTGAWAAWLLSGGGAALDTPFGLLRSRSPDRPVVVSGLLSLWYYARWRGHWKADAGPLARIEWPNAIALAAVVATLGLGYVWGNPLATGADASGYVSQAELWVAGTLTRPTPVWTRDAPWGDAAFTAAPVGYRSGYEPHTIVPFYPAGYPLVMAAFRLVGGRPAMFAVVPLLGALTVWLTYLLGRSLGGPWTGATASVLLLASPAFLVMLMTAMSDVPVTAWWTLAVYAALRPTTRGAVLSGLAAALAISTRPNTAPLAAVVALLVLVEPQRRGRRGAWFAALVALGVAFVAASNWQWYGSPLRSAYGTLQDIYALDRVWPNAQNYARWLWDTETPLIALACAAPWLSRGAGRNRAGVLLMTLVFPLTVVALYLPYLVWQEWVYLRFLLPAYPVVLAGVAALLVQMASNSGERARGAAAAAVVVVAFVYHGLHDDVSWRELAASEQRYARVLQYATRLPERAVFLSLNHSGTIHFYAQRDVLRWESLGRGDLDVAVMYLRARQYAVYLVADDTETEPFRRYFESADVARQLESAARRQLGGVSVYAVGGTRDLP